MKPSLWHHKIILQYFKVQIKATNFEKKITTFVFKFFNKVKAKWVHKLLILQLCDTSSPDNDENNSQIYSAPVAELGSTTNLNQVASTSEATAQC